MSSGRWQARYHGPDGIDRPAPQTFVSKRDAEVWLSVQESELVRGRWIDPAAENVRFGRYAEDWIAERPNLRPKTLTLYGYLMRAHLTPTFGNRTLGEIREAGIRHWRKNRLDDGVAPVTLAKAYRLMRAVLNTAVDDGLLVRNPCRIKGAGQEHSPERPTLSVPAVFALADNLHPRYRALLLTTTFCSLRWSEVSSLRRKHLDLDRVTVRIDQSKTDAGRRTVAIPSVIVPDLREHLREFSQPGPDGLVFVGPTGGPLNHSNFISRAWKPALAAAGLPPMHIHDLRHTGNTLTAEAGANLRELMERMGHTSTRAALIYLHSSADRQRRIAEDLSELVRAQREGLDSAPRASGTERARDKSQSR